MNLHLKATRNNKRFIHFKVFIDKIPCGELCMKREDAFYFTNMLRLYAEETKFTGNWGEPR